MDPISNYIQRFLPHPHPILEELEAGDPCHPRIQPSVGRQVGSLLGWLVQLTEAQWVLEFGTCLGYSTIYLAAALRRTGGRMVGIELDPDLVQTTRRNVEQAGLADIVEILEGNASQVVRELEGPFDLILQDSDKALYPGMLEDCVDLLRRGGILAADDALFQPMGIADHFARPVHEYNRRVFAHPHLVSTILPIGDGLTLSVRL
jgi:predicted O-methyltransferase YrrM